MGIVTMGIPLCSGFATMMYQAGYAAMGSLGGFLPFIAVLVVALIVLVVFLADDPADKGFNPDNGAEAEAEEEKELIKKASGQHRNFCLLHRYGFMVLHLVFSCCSPVD